MKPSTTVRASSSSEPMRASSSGSRNLVGAVDDDISFLEEIYKIYMIYKMNPAHPENLVNPENPVHLLYRPLFGSGTVSINFVITKSESTFSASAWKFNSTRWRSTAGATARTSSHETL